MTQGNRYLITPAKDELAMCDYETQLARAGLGFLFKLAMVDAILAGNKTQTRRLDPSGLMEGNLFYAKLGMYCKRADAPALLRVVATRWEYLLDITEADARAEGFPNRAAFLKYFKKIYSGKKLKSNPLCHVIEFEVVMIHPNRRIKEAA